MHNKNILALDMNTERLLYKPSLRSYCLDLARGIACLGMFVFHVIYLLYSFHFISTPWATLPFWSLFQKIVLGSFLIISGFSFTLSSQHGLTWRDLLHRVFKLASSACAITLITYIVEPTDFVRFGIIHFLSFAMLIAMLVKNLHKWLIFLGVFIIFFWVAIGSDGIHPNTWLYMTGLMSNRPSSMDYIPLIPWIGVFIIGMGAAHCSFSQIFKQPSIAPNYIKPIIWLGQHSLAFYLIHSAMIYCVFYIIAFIIMSKFN